MSKTTEHIYSDTLFKPSASVGSAALRSSGKDMRQTDCHRDGAGGKRPVYAGAQLHENFRVQVTMMD